MVADTKMVQFHGSDNIEKYVLTVMNMVSAGPCGAGMQGTMEPWNALGGERLQAHPGAPPDMGRVTFHRPGGSKPCPSPAPSCSRGGTATVSLHQRPQGLPGGIPGGTLANPHQQVVPTLPSPWLPCPVPRPCGGWAGGSKPEAKTSLQAGTAQPRPFHLPVGLRAVPLSFPPGDRGRASQGGAGEDS